MFNEIVLNSINNTPEFNSGTSRLELERTPGAAAVSGTYGREPAGGYPLPVSLATNSFSSPLVFSSPSSCLPDKKAGKVRGLAHQWQHMKRKGRYLDYMQYYNSEADIEVLKRCHTSWYRERQGGEVRYRACGCGRRFDCPLCSSYVQLQLAIDASNSMSLALTALDVGGVKYQHYGLKLVFTIPKETSARIDGLLCSDTQAWSYEVGSLFQELIKLIKRWYGKGVGILLGLDLTGESNPVTPHYHINVFVFPAIYENGHWTAIDGWSERISDMRKDWTAVVNKRYGLHLANADFRYGYLKTEGQMRHWHNYMYRPVQSDVWRGWQIYDGQSIGYRYWKGRKSCELSILNDDMCKVFDRVSLLPKHFKRLRWAGIFSDGQRGKTMEEVLGLERVEVKKDEETSETEGWERDSVIFKVVAYVAEGAIMRNTENGAVFKLHDKYMDYRPDLVRTGRRVRWQEPGMGQKLASTAIENTKRYLGFFNSGVLAGINKN